MSERKEDLFEKYYNMALDAQISHDYEIAIQYYRSALTFDPSNTLALLHLAKLYLKTSKMDNVLDVLKATLSIDNQNLEAYILMIKYYNALNDIDNVKIYSNKAIEIDQTYAEPYFILGKVFLKEGNEEKALKFFVQALQYNSLFTESIKALGYYDKVINYIKTNKI